jgi:UDP-2,4-diacetamido-2,4,6-trideoxy-beta-L-altropyranose hydrolase
MNIVFRVDASVEMGTGHVMRCLSLADGLKSKGAACFFVCRLHNGSLIDLIEQRGFTVFILESTESYVPSDCSASNRDSLLNFQYRYWLGVNQSIDADQTMAAIKGLIIDWLVIDHYAIDSEWEVSLKKHCKKIMVIDDLANRSHVCDLLLDQSWLGLDSDSRYDGLVPKYCQKLLGPKYAIINQDYLISRNSASLRNGVIHRILIFFGGSDPANLTFNVFMALKAVLSKNIILDVIVGRNYAHLAEIASEVNLRKNSYLYTPLPSLVELISRADLMIGAGGSTTWERMCVGLPAVVVSIADNQVPGNLALSKSGLINYVGEASLSTPGDICTQVQNCIDHPSLMRAQSKLMKTLVPGCGLQYLVDYIFSGL